MSCVFFEVRIECLNITKTTCGNIINERRDSQVIWVVLATFWLLQFASYIFFSSQSGIFVKALVLCDEDVSLSTEYLNSNSFHALQFLSFVSNSVSSSAL
jgi:hypothetical protein